MNYINIEYNGVIETVDEFGTFEEASLMLQEYLMINSRYYISNRCTKDWEERN